MCCGPSKQCPVKAAGAGDTRGSPAVSESAAYSTPPIIGAAKRRIRLDRIWPVTGMTGRRQARADTIQICRSHYAPIMTEYATGQRTVGHPPEPGASKCTSSPPL